MASLRDIRNRIKSVKNTGQITRAMQLVAASKMRKAQDKAVQQRPYAIRLCELLAAAENQAELRNFQHPLLAERAGTKRGVLILSTDKGLCGGLNANLFKKIKDFGPDAAFITVGRKAKQYIARTRRESLGAFHVGDTLSFSEIRPILDLFTQSYLDGHIATMEILYPHFVNTMVQEPEVLKIAPAENLRESVDRIKARMNVELAAAEDTREFIFEPRVMEMMDELARQVIPQEVFHVLCEARASEHSARMVAMKAATDNAKKLVDELTLTYNKERQAAITQEILEISAAAGATA